MDNLNNDTQMLIYRSSTGDVKVDVRIEDDTVRLNQESMAELFGKGRSTIAEHIQNVFKECELYEEKVCRNFRQTTPHVAMSGKTLVEKGKR